MIKHIVLWKLDASYSAEEKKAVKVSIREKLLGLKGEIEVLKKLDVFFNDEKAAEANFDVMLDTEFTDIDALNTYQTHPAHVKVVEYVKTLKLQRAAIDYSF